MQRCIATLLFVTTFALFTRGTATAQYQLTNLSSNQVKQARHIDPLLVNAWGLVHGAGSPWWVSDNGSGWSTLYDGAGNTVQQLKVLVPTAGENGPGSPTGIVVNGSNEFQVEGWASIFLFATLDGTISGWAPQSNFNQAIVAVNHSQTGAVYTGLAVTQRSSGNRLFAANMAQGAVEVYDATFKAILLPNAFADPNIPAGFAPFNVSDINGSVYVTYASTTGAEGGFVDQFTEDGVLVNGKTLITGFPLNQPWGIAVAPANFGPFSNALLIANNTNAGTINAFNPVNGTFLGRLKDASGKLIQIDQVWGIGFGDGKGKNGAANQLFFAAGPVNNFAGSFGVITFKP